MWDLSEPWWHFVVRALIVYFAVILLLRLMGKKQIGEFSPFDFALLLIISEAVNPALIGEDHSVPGGLIAAVTLCSVNYFVDYLAFKNKKIEKLMEGEPQMIIKNGKIIQKTKNSELITDDELEAALRKHGIDDIKKVAYAVLESDGNINIIKKKEAQT